MTAYKDFVQDFPSRCKELQTFVNERANHKGREVTLLIAIASAGFVIPYERIKKGHPMGDSDKFEDLSKEVKKLEKETFLDSDLYPNTPTDWRTGEAEVDEIKEMPNYWRNKEGKPVSKEKVEDILRILRNALAHGNIFTLTKGNSITEVRFAREKRNQKGDPVCYPWVSLSPEEFSKFLNNWFKFIKSCSTKSSK